MGKQFEFYSYKNDDEMIANTLRSVFGELLCVPRYKGDLSPFDICANDRLMYLTGKSFQQYISYYTHEYYDGTTAEVLDYVKSPVLEYRVPFHYSELDHIPIILKKLHMLLYTTILIYASLASTVVII